MRGDDEQRSTASLLNENAHLRALASDYVDSAFTLLLYTRDLWTLEDENQYIRELLEWDAAPIVAMRDRLPVSFVLVDAKYASDDDVSSALRALIAALRDLRQEIVFTDHLSDRALYRIIVTYLLSTPIKYMQRYEPITYWDFSAFDEEKNLMKFDDESVWASYYASDSERVKWSLENGRPAPPKRLAAYHRDNRVSQRELHFH